VKVKGMISGLQLDRLPVHLFSPYVGDALPAALVHADASMAAQVRALSTPAGWQIDTEEKVIFAGESFKRWRMIKDLNQPQEMGRDG
jgi:hypothetical protein